MCHINALFRYIDHVPVLKYPISLNRSLRDHLVKLANIPLLFYEKCEKLLQCKIFSHITNKNNSVFVMLYNVR